MRIYANMSSLAPWVDPLPSDLDSLREELGVTYTNYRTGDEDVPVRRIYWTGRLQRDPKDRTKTDPTKPRRWQLLFNIASSTTRSVAVELQAPDASKPYTYVSLASNAHLDAEHTSGFADVSATCHPPLTVRRFLEDMLRDARLHQYALRKHTNLIGLRGRRFWLFRVLQELSDDQRRCLPQGTYSEFVVLADKCRGSPPRTSTPQLREQTSWRPHRRRSPYTPEALQYPPIRDGEFVANHAWKQVHFSCGL
jgi:hypothetical protein